MAEQSTLHCTARPSGALPLRRKICYSMIVLLGLVVVAELAARVMWQPRTIRSQSVGTRKFVTWLSGLSLGGRSPLELYESDSDMLWKLAPGQRFSSHNYHCAQGGQLQPITISINSLGYRGPEVTTSDAANADLSVLCLGDSNFFGYPLDDEFAFPATLQQRLAGENDSMNVQVLNAGVPGYTTVQGKRWFDQSFSKHEFDWILLSFINNDAWPQPFSDDVLIQKNQAKQHSPLADAVVGYSRFLQFARSLKEPSRQLGTELPRVSQQRFRQNYIDLISAARANQARVYILDYCVYHEYLPYMQILKGLASNADDVSYLHVPEHVLEALQDNTHHLHYSAYTESIRERWGDRALEENPLLWFFAEFHPEHLNELGTAWLSDMIAPSLAGGMSASVELDTVEVTP